MRQNRPDYICIGAISSSSGTSRYVNMVLNKRNGNLTIDV